MSKLESRALSAFTHPTMDEITSLCFATTAVCAIWPVRGICSGHKSVYLQKCEFVRHHCAFVVRSCVGDGFACKIKCKMIHFEHKGCSLSVDICRWFYQEYSCQQNQSKETKELPSSDTRAMKCLYL